MPTSLRQVLLLGKQSLSTDNYNGINQRTGGGQLNSVHTKAEICSSAGALWAPSDAGFTDMQSVKFGNTLPAGGAMVLTVTTKGGSASIDFTFS